MSNSIFSSKEGIVFQVKVLKASDMVYLSDTKFDCSFVSRIIGNFVSLFKTLLFVADFRIALFNFIFLFLFFFLVDGFIKG